MSYLKPPALKKDDLLGVMAPSSVVIKTPQAGQAAGAANGEREKFDKSVSFLEQRGFQVLVHPQTFARDRSSAGTVEDKAKALRDLFSDARVKAVFSAGGGNHAPHLARAPDDDGKVAEYDYKLLRRNPKIFMGFSDNTVLLNAFNRRAGLTTFHGPVVTWLPDMVDADHTFDLLAGKKVSYPVPNDMLLHAGRAEGPLVGGNLSLFQAMIGTKYMPKLDGAILFIEDIGEEYSKLDRMLWHLRAAGVFDKISGLLIGQFSDMTDKGSISFGWGLLEIVERNTQGLDIPIVADVPFGHERKKFYAMPIGCPARLDISRRGKVSLALTEPAVLK